MEAINNWSRLHEKCIKCNKTNSPHKAKGLCTACYQREHEYPQNICSICGNIGRVHKKVDGKNICRKCYKEPAHTCSVCSKEATAAYKLSSTEFVCDSCYVKNYRTKQLCSICNHVEILAVNTATEKVCVRCYPTLNNSCSKCGRDVKSPYIVGGNHVCSRCYENYRQGNLLSNLDIRKESYNCSICGKSGMVQRIYSDNSIICPICYKQQSDICISCSNPIFPIHSHLNALPYCRNCYYRLKFEAMFINLKKNWSESFIRILEDYFNSKAHKVSYETIWEHIRVSEALLNDLYIDFIDNGSIFLPSSIMKIIKNHLSRKVFIYDFIAFLCSEGILSDYNSGQFLIDNLNDQIDEFPTNFKSVIIGYEKALLQKFAKYHEKGWVNENSRFSYFTCYLYILSALRFLTFIVSVLNLQQPTEINNHTIDAFLRLKPYDKGNLRHFIMHINKNKITFMQLTLPNSNYKHELHVSISDDKQQQLIEACLYNEDILLRDRIIVLLMLLYGITPIEIRTLKRDNFIISKSKCTSKILYQNNQIKHEIPSKISSIVLKYLNSLHESAEFTFPGRLLNTSISLSSICRIMKYFNVSSTELHYTAINNSMLNGLYQPALLMKSFGINHMTAIRYFYLIKNLE